jgi:hypothetical protein
MQTWLAKILCAGVLAMGAVAAHAAGMPEFRVVLKNHQFQPASLKVPADTKFKVVVTNGNAVPSEFESTDLNREKIVMPDSTITVFIGPLAKGTYTFYDDFHRSTKGALIAE